LGIVFGRALPLEALSFSTDRRVLMARGVCIRRTGLPIGMDQKGREYVVILSLLHLGKEHETLGENPSILNLTGLRK